MQTSNPRQIFRVRDFELDVAAYELRRQGRAVKLGRQPMDLLILLVESRGQLVSRTEIVDRLWGKDVFVDVETGVNTAISKVRQALRDSPDAPAFVETVPGKGYRFIAAVEVVSGAPHADLPAARLKPSLVPARDQANGVTTALIPDAESPSTGTSSPTRMDAGGEGSPPSRRGAAKRARLAIGLAAVAMAAAAGAGMWFRGGAGVPRVTLAVLPFANIGSDPEHEYLAAGLTEETSASLAQIDPQRLIVKGRTLRYKGTTKTAVEIGQELAVDYLVESTIRAERGRLRVTATLIRVRDQVHVWSRSYEREPSSFLGLQQELSTAIAGQIRVRLSSDDVRGFGGRQTQNADAFDAYLRGRYLESRRTPATNARAVREYQRAIALDPDYALAWSRLGFTYAASVEQRYPSPRNGASGARRRRARGRRQPEPRGVAGGRRVCQLVARLGLDSRGGCLPSRDSSRSERRGGVSIARARALAIGPAWRSRVSHAPHAGARAIGAAQLRAVGTGRVPGARVSRRRRPRAAGDSHGLGVLDRLYRARTGVRAHG